MMNIRITKRNLLLGFTGLFFAAIAVLGIIFLLSKESSTPDLNRDEGYESKEDIPVEDEDQRQTKEYESERFGVRFTYDPIAYDEEVVVGELGSRIYLTVGDDELSSGQFIEVFDKDPKVSLDEAIRAQFSLSEKCSVRMYDSSSFMTFAVQMPQGYVFAGIVPPPLTQKRQEAGDPWWANTEECSSYTESNGIRYFMMNEEVPSRFLFVDIGQYILTYESVGDPEDSNRRPWENSIRIIGK